MGRKSNILESETGNNKISKLPFDELVKLGEKYPYCDLFDVFINRNLYKENGNLSLLQMSSLINKTNNPGLSFTSVIEKKSETSKKVKKNKKTNELIKGGSSSKAEKDNSLNKENLKEGIVSEQLARIYVKQGMIGEAIEMYKQLSLQNPKKNTYFAEILKKLNKL